MSTTVSAAAGLLVLGLPGLAWAHVGVAADTTEAGSSAVLTLSVPHGCDGSPTTRVATSIPAGITEVTPIVDAGWVVTTTTERLATPVVLEDGDQVTERTSEVVWTAREPLRDGFRADLRFVVDLPAGGAGETLSFPTRQSCDVGSTDWTQVAPAGVGEDELEHPAPSIEVSEASAQVGSDHHGAGAALTTSTQDALSQAASGSGSSAPAAAAPADTPVTSEAAPLGLLGLVAGLLGLAVGIMALARTRAPVRPDRA